MRLTSKLKVALQPKGKVSNLAQKMQAEGLTYLDDRKFARLERCLVQAAAQDVPGDFVEFGVALGGSSIVIATVAGEQGRRFLGFDVFGMIPPPSSEKDDEKSKARYQEIAAGKSRGIKGARYYGYVDDLYRQVCDSFEQNGLTVDGDRIQLIKGLFDQTVPHADLGDLAFVHLDCDWYDPVMYCLTAVADRLSPGGCILLDDYHDYGGCQAAVDEFRKANPGFRFEDGRNVILRKTG